jgi:hypothetical protein
LSVRGRQEPRLRKSGISTPESRAERVAIGPNDDLAVASLHRISDLPNDPFEQPWDAVFRPEYPQRAVLTLHDRRGRVLWNRPWLSSEASTQINAVHVDAAGWITVQVSADAGPLSGTTVARLDGAGKVLWQRLIGDHRFTVQSAIDAAGNLYTLAWHLDFESPEVRLERFDTHGRSTGAWSLAQLWGAPELHSGRDGIWVTHRTDVGLGAELWVFSFDSATAVGCPGRRYAWAHDVLAFFTGTLQLVEAAGEGVYVASSGWVSKLEGNVP